MNGNSRLSQNKQKGGKAYRKYEIILDAIKKINAEWTEKEVKEYLGEKYNIVDRQQCTYYSAARAALDYRIERYEKDVAKKNIARINAIIDEADENGNLKIQLDAIDMLNKMAGVYVNKLDINADKPIFEIKIGE